MSEQKITLEISGEIFHIFVNQAAAPVAASAIGPLLPLEGKVVHSMWSGPLLLMGGINLADAPLENEAAFLRSGDLAYHPGHHEIGIAYSTTQWREPVGPVYVTLLGRIEGDLGRLAEIGRSTQRNGAQKLSIG